MIPSLMEERRRTREPRWKMDQWRAVAKAEEKKKKKKKLWSVKSRAFSFYWADSHSPHPLPPGSPDGVCALP